MALSYTQIKHYSRCIGQWMSKLPVGVIGGYHGGNLGDMALGKSVTRILASQQIKSGMQTIYNLDKWPTTEYAIVGGGAVGYVDSLTRVAERYKSDYSKVALLGVDFMETSYPQTCLNLIRGAAFVSGRSKVQAERLTKLTGREDVINHPDLAFSLMNDFCSAQREQSHTSRSKKLLVNVVPLYGMMRNGVLEPSIHYKDERPELFENFNQMHSSYSTAVRTIIEEAIEKGFQVETIPFTQWDEVYGRTLLEGLPVYHTKYDPEPIKMLKKISEAEWVIATRFHATIFALKAGVKISPIAYATKNELLLQELGVDKSNYLSTKDLAYGKNKAPEPIVVNSSIIKSFEDESANGIRKCIRSLGIASH